MSIMVLGAAVGLFVIVTAIAGSKLSRQALLFMIGSRAAGNLVLPARVTAIRIAVSFGMPGKSGMGHERPIPAALVMSATPPLATTITDISGPADLTI